MTEDCRQAFEEWLLGRMPRVPECIERLEDGQYRSPITRHELRAFQAGRASAPAPEVTEEMVAHARVAYNHAYRGGHGNQHDSMKIALQAALNGRG